MASSIIGAVGSIGSSLLSKKKASTATASVENTTYQRVDLDELQARARQVASENIANSLALEQKYSPGVASARADLQSQIADELKLGGNISPDVANQVVQQATTRATSAGLEGGAGPITAATLGLAAMDLKNQRQQKAAQLIALNPTPESGISPGSLASAAVADINAANQFAIGKTQAQQNASNANTSASSGLLGSAVGALGKIDFSKLFQTPPISAPSTTTTTVVK